MEDADIDVASVTQLTRNRAQSWLLESPSCDTELTRFSKPHTHAEELRQEAQKHIVTNYTGCTHYYTDGSKTSQGTGCAFVSECGGLASERRRFFGGHQSLSDLVGKSPNIPCDVLM